MSTPRALSVGLVGELLTSVLVILTSVDRRSSSRSISPRALCLAPADQVAERDGGSASARQRVSNRSSTTLLLKSEPSSVGSRINGCLVQNSKECPPASSEPSAANTSTR